MPLEQLEIEKPHIKTPLSTRRLIFDVHQPIWNYLFKIVSWEEHVGNP